MKATDIEVSPATPEDIPTAMQINKETWFATYPVNTEYKGKPLVITEEDVSAKFSPDSVERRITRWQETLQTDPNRKTFVARVEGEIAGYVAITDTIEEKRVGAMYVHPTQQGKGIGGALMKKALDTLGRNHRIVLNVAGYNESAIAFYKGFGFEITRDVQAVAGKLPSGAEIPEVEMVRNPD